MNLSDCEARMTTLPNHWALRLGAKPPIAWTAEHERAFVLCDQLWDDLRAVWIRALVWQEAREDATGDSELLAARSAEREARAGVDAAFDARRAARKSSRSREVAPEIETEIKRAIGVQREARKALYAAAKRVRGAIREDLRAIWKMRDRVLYLVAAGVQRRYPEMHFGPYNDVLARFKIAARAAAKKGRVVQRAERHPSQSLYQQVTGARQSWAGLHRASAVVQLEPYALPAAKAGRWELLSIRCDQSGTMLRLPVRVDRLPAENSRIKGVRVVRRGREWHAVVSIEGPVLTPIERGAGTLYCGLNWRSTSQGLRVLDGIDEEGTRVRVNLPHEMVASVTYSDLLLSALDRAAEIAGQSLDRADLVRSRDWPALRAIAVESGDADLVTWARGEARGRDLHDALLRVRRAARGDAEKQAIGAAAVVGDAVGRRQVEGLRSKALRRREDLYRRCARWICERYSRIVLGQIDGAKLARLEAEDGTPTDLPAPARRNRQMAAPYAMASALRWAAARAGIECIEAETVDLSHVCPICGEEMERSPGDRARLNLYCTTHGQWDRDHALALALWRDDAPADRERWLGHASLEQRSQARIVRVEAEVEARLQSVRPPLSRLRYVCGRALADGSGSSGTEGG